jgi:hypothetical protein
LITLSVLAACSENLTPEEAREWIIDYETADTFEEFSANIRSITARNFIEQCYVGPFEQLHPRRNNPDFFRQTKAGILDSSLDTNANVFLEEGRTYQEALIEAVSACAAEVFTPQELAQSRLLDAGDLPTFCGETFMCGT